MLFIKIRLSSSIDLQGLSKNYKIWTPPGGTYTGTGANAGALVVGSGGGGADAGAVCIHTPRRDGVLSADPAHRGRRR